MNYDEAVELNELIRKATVEKYAVKIVKINKMR